ncbi:unnamed protein product [Strongylus vulgaris]|uniref:Uncharacterized protein n=1 Tax=Strongylus vulgaris TaxID=40348 RepID=A0A3P7IQE0_STRVU|nr:unnamed protein product [Strongylus vulgaris]
MFQSIAPGSEKEVGDLLTDVLNTVSAGGTSCCVHDEVPSTSGGSRLEQGGNSRARKRSYEGLYSQEFRPRKKLRSEDPTDESRTRERLI